jgi:Glyoxalase-like domain
MPTRFQLVIDCADPELLARFWAAALGYALEQPPDGFATWNDWRRDIGLPDGELGMGADSIIDPGGAGPRIWFHMLPDAKVVKNRLHLDIHASTTGPYLSSIRAIPIEVRKQRVDAEARRLVDLGATITGLLSAEGLDHYAVGMKDPEGNEFDIN